MTRVRPRSSTHEQAGWPPPQHVELAFRRLGCVQRGALVPSLRARLLQHGTPRSRERGRAEGGRSGVPSRPGPAWAAAILAGSPRGSCAPAWTGCGSGTPPRSGSGGTREERSVCRHVRSEEGTDGAGDRRCADLGVPTRGEQWSGASRSSSSRCATLHPGVGLPSRSQSGGRAAWTRGPLPADPSL